MPCPQLVTEAAGRLGEGLEPVQDGVADLRAIDECVATLARLPLDEFDALRYVGEVPPVTRTVHKGTAS